MSTQSLASTVPSDSYNMNSFPQTMNGFSVSPNSIPISMPPTSFSPPQPIAQPPIKTIVKAKSNEYIDKRSRE